MPNWCMNQLTLEHEDKSMIERFEKAFNENRSCQEFLPQPEGIGEGWYEWCLANWGTKWDFGCDGAPPVKADGNKFVCSFDSAWTPPVCLYRELDRLGYKVNAIYFEPGCAFCGEWKDGEDDCVAYASNFQIPARIWKEFELEEWFKDEEEV